MHDLAYDLFLPDGVPARHVFASPHSGRDYPAGFLGASVLDERAIRSSEDAFVDLLFASAPATGAALLAARAPRAYVDLNRAADELDPAVVEQAPRGLLNPRVGAGLGVIPRVVSNGRAIYRGKIPLEEAHARIAKVWMPYHACLQGLLRRVQAEHGEVILIDCHSMPHEAIETFSQGNRPRPEVVLGDRFGAAAAPEVVERIEAAFVAEGFRVARNAPFAGAYIAQAYGRPSRGQHVVQVEIDRALYMDEAAICPGPGFDGVRRALDRVIARILGPAARDHVALAAE